MLDKLECMNNNKYESIGGRPSVGISDRLARTVRTFVYIDGFNLYHGVNKLSDKTLKWCNLSKLFYNFTQPKAKIYELSLIQEPHKIKEG